MSAKIFDITTMVNTAKKLDNPPNRIREVRTAMTPKVTLRQIADALGTTETQISRFETGERPVDLVWLQRIARVLRTEVGQLLNVEDNETSLTDEERIVLMAMRSGQPNVAQTLVRVAEGLVPPAEEIRRRA